MSFEQAVRKLSRKLLIRKKPHMWLLTLALAVSIGAADRAGLQVPIPFLLLMISVALSAAIGGLRAGLLAGAMMSGFILYAWVIGFGPAMLTGSLARALLGALVTIGFGTYLGALRDTNLRLLRALERSRGELKKLNAELSERVEDRTRELAEATEQLQISQARLQRVTRRWLTTQETERRSVARDLHDDIGQSLTALRLSFEVGRMRFRQQPEVVEVLDTCKSLVDDIITSVRQLSLELRPAMLDDLGLFAAVEEHTTRQFAAGGPTLALHTNGDDRSLDTQMRVAVYRLVQEAVTNIVKHAQASAVSIDINATSRALAVVIRDDGVGFDTQQRFLESEHFGIVSMRERVGLINGELTITSTPGGGTELRVKVPMRPHEEVA